MDRVKQLAHNVYYSNKSLTEDEESQLLNSKYAYLVKKSPKQTQFDTVANRYTTEESEEALLDPQTNTAQQNVALSVLDDIENTYGVDIDNTSPDKFKKLNSHISTIKKNAIKSVQISQMSDVNKGYMIQKIQNESDICGLLYLLFLFAGSKAI